MKDTGLSLAPARGVAVRVGGGHGDSDPGLRLLGRQSERAALDLLVSAVGAGESETLVLRGDAGVGNVEARSRALVSEGDDADALYREAISPPAKSRFGVESARTRCSTANGCAARTAASMLARAARSA